MLLRNVAILTLLALSTVWSQTQVPIVSSGSFDATQYGDTTWGDGTAFTWTFDAGATDPLLDFASGSITVTGSTSNVQFPSTGGILLDPGGTFDSGSGLTWGDGDVTFYELSDDKLRWDFPGTEKVWQITNQFMGGDFTGYPVMDIGNDAFGFNGKLLGMFFAASPDRLEFRNSGFVPVFEVGGNDTVLVYDSTATTGDTTTVIKEGAGQASDSFQVVNNSDVELFAINAGGGVTFNGSTTDIIVDSAGGLTIDNDNATGLANGITLGSAGTAGIGLSAVDVVGFYTQSTLMWRLSGADLLGMGAGAQIKPHQGDTAGAPGFNWNCCGGDDGFYMIADDNFAATVSGNKFMEWGGSQTVQIEDTTATTGDTAVVIKEGAGQSSAPLQVTDSADASLFAVNNGGGFGGPGRELSSLGTPADGTIKYCTDCAKGSDPCTGSSTGAMAMRVNGAWQCM